MRTVGLYGLRVCTELPLPGAEEIPADGCPQLPQVSVELADPGAVRARLRGAGEPAGELHTSDGRVLVTRGAAGELLLEGDGVGLFAISPTGDSILCAVTDPGAPRCLRMLLDTVLGTAALQAGLEGLHAGAVLVDGRLVAVAAAEGAGKSSLAVEAIRRGASLYTDDLLFLEAMPGGRVVAHPGAAVMNLPLTASVPGRRLAAIADEQWIELTRELPAARAPSLVAILDRRPGAGPARAVPEPSPAALIAVALDSGAEPQRRSARLELLAALARSTPIVRLSADVAVPSRELADALWTALGHVGALKPEPVAS